MAFTAKPLQGDVLIELLQNEEPSLKESALRALSRLLPALWQRHAQRVAEMLEDQVTSTRRHDMTLRMRL